MLRSFAELIWAPSLVSVRACLSASDFAACSHHLIIVMIEYGVAGLQGLSSYKDMQGCLYQVLS